MYMRRLTGKDSVRHQFVWDPTTGKNAAKCVPYCDMDGKTHQVVNENATGCRKLVTKSAGKYGLNPGKGSVKWAVEGPSKGTMKEYLDAGWTFTGRKEGGSSYTMTRGNEKKCADFGSRGYVTFSRGVRDGKC
jgi:hypothetical protein